MSFWKKVVAIVVGVVVIVIAYWLISPLFIERKVNEELEEIVPAEMGMQEIEERAMGIFQGLAGHTAVGTARLLKIGDVYYIRFDDDFHITNGPDLFVHLGKDGNYDPKARLDSLKGNVGAQNYAIPSDISVDDYNEVWVWCRSFAVPFGKAVLK